MIIKFMRENTFGEIQIDEKDRTFEVMTGDRILKRRMTGLIAKGIEPPSTIRHPAIQEIHRAAFARGMSKQIKQLEDLLGIWVWYDSSLDRWNDFPSEGMGYTALRWNGKTGDEAKFVMRRESDNSQTLFSSSHDIIWTHTDMANEPNFAAWHCFGDQRIDSLAAMSIERRDG